MFSLNFSKISPNPSLSKRGNKEKHLFAKGCDKEKHIFAKEVKHGNNKFPPSFCFPLFQRGIKGDFYGSSRLFKGHCCILPFLKGTSNISTFCKGGKGDFMFSLNSQLHFASPFEKGGLRGILDWNLKSAQKLLFS